MQRVFLVGARASGKSTIGRSLAETLGCPFLDTDTELTRDLGCSIDVFVKENGWDAFRRKEHETLKRLAGSGEKKQDGEWLVIATGGGMVLLPENRKILREKGVTFYLEAPVEVLVRRLSEDPMSDTRPSLTGQGLLEEVAGVVKSREPLYREASHHCVSTDQSVKNIVREISQKLHKAIPCPLKVRPLSAAPEKLQENS